MGRIAMKDYESVLRRVYGVKRNQYISYLQHLRYRQSLEALSIYLSQTTFAQRRKARKNKEV